MPSINIPLACTPNAGKSTIFNALTGSRQHVGDWPGKTVEKKEGAFTHGDTEVQVTDLPGTYSLSAYSPEEMIARDYILDRKPDLVVAVVDAERQEFGSKVMWSSIIGQLVLAWLMALVVYQGGILLGLG